MSTAGAVAPTRNTGLLRQICDPYGTESQVRLMGGLHPESHYGRYKWGCLSYADARYRMACRCGHKGQVMPLCTPHRGEIQRRQAGLCPKCAWPERATDIKLALEHIDRERTAALMRQDYPALVLLQQRAETMGTRMDDLIREGIVHRCPLQLTEVS